MHPDDVLDVVTAQVERLRAEIERYPELGVTDVELRGLELRVGFIKTVRPPARVNLPAGVVLPGGGQAIHTLVAIDLGRVERRELLLVMDCSEFDGQPPTAELRAATDVLLPDAQWPRDPGRGWCSGLPTTAGRSSVGEDCASTTITLSTRTTLGIDIARGCRCIASFSNSSMT